MDEINQYPKKQGLYDPSNEKGSCGVGFIADINGDKSYEIIKNGLQILKNMAHRGATGADPETGDGAGLMIQIPHEFYKDALSSHDITLPDVGQYSAAMIFLPLEPNTRYYCEGVCERIIEEEGCTVIAWRDVEVNDKACGLSARGTRPVVQQLFIKDECLDEDKFKRQLYVIRKRIENEMIQSSNPLLDTFFVCSMSTRTIVYKGQLLAHQIEKFYLELTNPKLQSAIAVVHQRYSTNTFPSWKLAHPYRYVSHNGEINTIKGNVKWMTAREGEMKSKNFGKKLNSILPITNINSSDSFNFDCAMEFMMLNGYSTSHALKALMPEAWRYDATMDESLRSFYEYHEGLIEPWDGPATIAYSDGLEVGVALDRNGLRPARYVITKDNQVIMASEEGVLKIDEENILEKGKLGPGKMFIVDTQNKKVLYDKDIVEKLTKNTDYAKWINKNKVDLADVNDIQKEYFDKNNIMKYQKIFGYTEEELKRVVAPMASDGKEAVTSMGNDVPLALLSDEPQLMFNYFRQMFAQVTNPPIDPIREKKMMSLNQYIGRSGDILKHFEDVDNKPYIELEQPILYRNKMERIKNVKIDSLRSITIPILFEVDTDDALKNALEVLFNRVEESVKLGYRMIILSDKTVDRYNAPIPSILAVSAVHNYLINKKQRSKVDIIIETGEARDSFHMALLIGYGATAVYPYLALESIKNLVKNDLYIDTSDSETACMNYVRSLGYGLRKITSKMGISTLRSFNGAQIFEILGLNSDVVSTYFTDSVHRLAGIGLEVISKETLIRHQSAFNENVDQQLLETGGNIHWRKGESTHLLEPEMIADLQHACRTDDYKLFKTFAKRVDDQSTKLKTIRGLLAFNDCTPIALEEVEPVENILKRFATGAMSFGSLSKEVHETLAVAMNRIGAKSNSGEGGEDRDRYLPMSNGDSKRSSIKQVAASRFGVDTEYLVQATELQIKVAQGAKPGEGGHLPGRKVTEAIAKVRHSLPGIDLISPPPHHDIYSIEDLEQLIFDLKNVNTDARVSVKLVSEAGVGTIAAGVAKGSADMVLISGHDGGTGAAAITSVKTAGIPWEIGLSETHQTLLLNNLRSRIAVQVDGQLRTARDVAVATLLGAEEFGFATAPLIVSGCIMMRKCHSNTCPVGVATQDPELRKNFKGKPEHIINYFKFIAQDLRVIMAGLGLKSVDDMIGRSDLLRTKKSNVTWKSQSLDLSDILYQPELPARFGRRKLVEQADPTLDVMDRKLIEQSTKAISSLELVRIQTAISNKNRSVGAMLSGIVAKKYGKFGLPDDTINIKFYGVAGQSFGAFLAKGITLELEGSANDYVGKSLSGGRIVIKPNVLSKLVSSENIIAGNTLLYGATSGEAYISGCVGERFAVRNSGAISVVESVGDHGCEYMTGGTVVILGSVGKNFAAGMSGGAAYVYDDENLLNIKCNREMVEINYLTESNNDELKTLIQNHYKYTLSQKSEKILSNWDQEKYKFKQVISPEYKAIIESSDIESLVG